MRALVVCVCLRSGIYVVFIFGRTTNYFFHVYGGKLQLVIYLQCRLRNFLTASKYNYRLVNRGEFILFYFIILHLSHGDDVDFIIFFHLLLGEDDDLSVSPCTTQGSA